MDDDICLVRLEADTEIKSFNCGNTDLNDFLFHDAKTHQRELIATTYLLMNNNETIAYWCYLNDKISSGDMNGNRIRFMEKIASKLGREIKEKEYESFPAVKIGRLGVNEKHKNKGFGTSILDYTKKLFIHNNRTGCRFITVDAFRDAIPFYEKNGFEFISGRDRKSETRQMYYNLKEFIPCDQ
jgi:GNAT superfamily N-acetyltransferase